MRTAGAVMFFLAIGSPVCLGGEIYGTISDGVRPVRGAQIEVLSPGRPTAVSDANGMYKVFVPEQGKFRLKLSHGGQAPVITVFSYQQSVRYDLILENRGGTFSLRRK